MYIKSLLCWIIIHLNLSQTTKLFWEIKLKNRLTGICDIDKDDQNESITLIQYSKEKVFQKMIELKIKENKSVIYAEGKESYFLREGKLVEGLEFIL